jgi:hypothetical protein
MSSVSMMCVRVCVCVHVCVCVCVLSRRRGARRGRGRSAGHVGRKKAQQSLNDCALHSDALGLKFNSNSSHVSNQSIRTWKHTPITPTASSASFPVPGFQGFSAGRQVDVCGAGMPAAGMQCVCLPAKSVCQQAACRAAASCAATWHKSDWRLFVACLHAAW